jgi:hypothetical protein
MPDRAWRRLRNDCVSEKGEGAVIGGSVNQGAVSQEQQNQQQGEQYAAQQQQAAIAAVNAWLKGNPSPNSTAAPLTMPGALTPSPASGLTPGGATAPGSAQPSGARTMQAPAAITNMGAAAPKPQLSPQQVQAIMAGLKTQGGGRILQ